jgi:tetratricopeptide (TPR) repeat protein
VEELLDELAAALKDRYTIHRELGRGGMAMVYLATDLRHDRSVAIKVLRPDLAASIGAERFLREIKTTAQLSHPNILPLFDSGRTGGPADRRTEGAPESTANRQPPTTDLLYYVMPYVEGETLADRLEREGTLPEEDTRRIASEVLGALEYAHRQGVIHRDIKPSNILLSAATGHALLADFGIARAISAAGAKALTQADVVVGTPSYMSPEQASGADVGPPTDIYAVGLVLYECLTGRRLPPPGFQSRTDWSPVPARFRGPLARALRTRPADRWPDAGAMRAALESGASRARWLGLAVAAAVVAIAVSLLSLFPPGGAPEGPAVDAARLVVFPFTARGAGELEYLGEGMVDLLSAKLDGAGSWRTVDPRAVLSLVGREGEGPIDPDAGGRLARQLHAGLFVLGSIIGVGEQIRLDASLYGAEPARGALAQASVEGAAGDVLALLDSMAVHLLSQSGEAEDARLTQIALMTSQSLPALKAYLRGVRALRAGEFPIAAADFQEAIGLDSGFALAWYQLSVTADWLLRADLARTAADQAVRYAARLPERDARLLEALYAIRQGDLDDAERRLRAILGTHPDDVEAWSQLGEALFHFGPPQGRPITVSVDAWRRLNELEPHRATGYIHLARVAASARDLPALDTLSRRALELAPQGDRGLEMRMLRLMLRDTPREREAVLADLREAPDDVLGEVLWSVGTFPRDSAIVLPVIAVIVGPERSAELRATGFSVLAGLEAAQGRWTASQAAVDSVSALQPAAGLALGAYLALVPALEGDTGRLVAYRGRLAAADWRNVPPSANRAAWFSAQDGMYGYFRRYLLGLTDALAGNAAAAAAEAEALRAATPPPGTGSALPDFAATIRATAAWRAGETDEALTALADVRQRIWHQLAAASPFFSEAYPRYLRALVLERAGRREEALRWYATFVDTNPQDLVFAAPAHYRQARLYEALGNVEEARRHYGEFLRMRADADASEAAMVTDAERRLEALGR